MSVVRTAAVAVLCVAWAHPGFSQASGSSAPETREALIARDQQEKERVASPYRPGRAEALFQRFEEEGFPFVGTPPGFYPAVGSVFPGGRLALGGGYRKFTGASALLDVHALYSIATYKRVEATYRTPGHLRGRLEFGGRLGWLDAPRIAYFGLGSDTERDEGTVFRLRETYAEGAASWRPIRWLQLGGTAAYEAYDEGAGTGPKPSNRKPLQRGECTAPRGGSYLRTLLDDRVSSVARLAGLQPTRRILPLDL